MTTKTQARAPARALVGAAAFGSLAGLAIGCAYLAGEAARERLVQAEAARFAGAGKTGYSEESLFAAAGGYDHAVVAIAGRHDPYTMAGGAERDRQAAQFAASFAPGSDALGLRRAADFRPGPAAPPFKMEGSLDASRDLQCLTEAVYWEARGEGQAGMAAVAQVVLNRVRHPAFPKTVCGVVYQGAQDGDCQFSFACQTHGKAVEDQAWIKAREIAAKALSGHVMSAVGNATNFHAVSVAPDWMGGLQKVAQIGAHIFYRFGHGGRAPADFRYAAEPANKSPTPQPVLASFAPVFATPVSAAEAKPVPPSPKASEDKPAAQPGQPDAKPAAAGAKVVEPSVTAPAEAVKPGA